MKSQTRMLLIFAMVILLGPLVSCNFDEIENKETTRDQYYLIEPKSVLQSIKQAKSGVFSVTNTKPGLVPPNEQVSVAWTQADYLRIAAALHQYVWGEPLTDWNISKIDFALGCTEVGVGLQNGRIEFFKNVKTRERESRITHFVDIDPRSNFVYISESEYYPKLVDWTPIDLTKIKIPADEALQISERSGGSEKRKVIGNACNISLIFSPSSANGYGWQIGYSKDGEAGYIFELQINPFTGAYK